MASKRISGPVYQKWMQFAIGTAAALIFVGVPAFSGTWAALKKKTKEFQGQLNDVQGHNNLHAQVESRVLQTQSGEVAPLTSEQKMVGTVNSPYNKDRILEPVPVDGAAKADTTPCGCEKS